MQTFFLIIGIVAVSAFVLTTAHASSKRKGYEIGYRDGMHDGLRQGFDAGARSVMEDHAEFVAKDPELLEIYNRRAAAKAPLASTEFSDLFAAWKRAKEERN